MGENMKKIKGIMNKICESVFVTNKRKSVRKTYESKNNTTLDNNYVLSPKKGNAKKSLFKRINLKKETAKESLINETAESKNKNKTNALSPFFLKWLKRFSLVYAGLFVLIIIILLFASLSCEHDYVEIENIPVTCVQDGKVTYQCSKCGKEYTETTELDKNLHTFNDGTITIEATCTSVGQILYKCIYCGDLQYQDVAALPHNNIEISRIEPTCTDAGVIYYECQDCGTKDEESLPELGHDYGEEIDIPPTCIETGKVIQKCSRCQDELLVKTYGTTGDHNYALVKTVDAKKGADGYELYRCSVCQDEYKKTLHYYVVFVSRNGIAHTKSNCSGMKYYTVVPVSRASGYKKCEHCSGYPYVCDNCN